MKKKIVAFLLVLCLVLAMTLPTFAVEARSCAHNWVGAGNVYMVYAVSGNDGHLANTMLPSICTLCAARTDRCISSVYESHNPNAYCPKCHYPNNIRSLETEF